jgi:hypothetical protein
MAPETDLPNTDDSSAEALAQKRLESKRINDEHFFREVLLASAAGRDWFYRHLDWCDLFGDPFMLGHADGTAYNLGRQIAGKHLWQQAEIAAPQLVRLMLTEHHNELAAIAQEVKRATEQFQEDEDPAAVVPEGPDAQYPHLSEPTRIVGDQKPSQ